MSTSSLICQKEGEIIRSIYCHQDGGLSHVGVILHRHYADPSKITRLIGLGALSRLAERTDPIGKHSFFQREPGTTVACHRDRGELIEIHESNTEDWKELLESYATPHIYVHEGEWFLYNKRGIKKGRLYSALKGGGYLASENKSLIRAS